MEFALVLIQDFSPRLQSLLLFAFFTGMAIVILSRFFIFFEQRFAITNKRPFFVHLYLFKRKLNDEQKSILRSKFNFYNRLSTKQKEQFEHRVSKFITQKHFLGREELIVSTEMKVLIAATSVMLTFGFRQYHIDLIDKVIIYPSSFYSNSNEAYHKGELSPRFKALVLSWEDFVKGYEIDTDNLNLGIHEFTHAIHLNSMKNGDISSIIFRSAFGELTDLLSENEALRQKLIASKYFRAYAFTNQFEFVAVIVETFIETPDDFKQQFPRIYNKTREMLNFNFAGY